MLNGRNSRAHLERPLGFRLPDTIDDAEADRVAMMVDAVVRNEGACGHGPAISGSLVHFIMAQLGLRRIGEPLPVSQPPRSASLADNRPLALAWCLAHDLPLPPSLAAYQASLATKPPNGTAQAA